jgi:hypothetical protein
LPSYPETTGLALLALAGCSDTSVRAVIPKAIQMHAQARSPMARAWLKLALRLWNVPLEESEEPAVRRPDVMLAAVEALGAADGNYRLLTPEGRA